MTSPTTLDGDAPFPPPPASLPEPDPDYPRPQLIRDRWTDLTGTWQFGTTTRTPAGRPLVRGRTSDRGVFDRDIKVPYPPESPASGIGDIGFHRVVWYRRSFDRREAGDRPGERVLLHFGAVDYRATVWVNGRLVATHEGGHTPFAADITPALTEGGRRSSWSARRTTRAT